MPSASLRDSGKRPERLHAMVERRVMAVRPPSLRLEPSSLPGGRHALHDPRWPAIRQALAGLRARRRRAVRIVDADCGAGALVILAVHHARALGFTAIEGRGIARSPALARRAETAARRAHDPAIGLEFTSHDLLGALRSEEALPADLLLWSGARDAAIDAALSRAAVLVIADDEATPLRSAA
jgi:hypothetical protein